MTHRKPGPKPNSANTRERILEAAQQLIAERGPENLRLQDIAERVGIRPPSVFGHFRGLDDVTETVFLHVLERLAGVLRIRADGDAVAELRQAIARLTAMLAENPANVRLILQQLGSGARAMEHFESGTAIISVIDQRVAELLALGQRSGQFRQVDAEEFMAMVIGPLLARLAWHNFEDWVQPDWPEQLQRIEAEVTEQAFRYLGAERLLEIDNEPLRATA